MASEIGRFPRLFRGARSIPGLTWPTMVFKDGLTLMMGKLERLRALKPRALVPGRGPALTTPDACESAIRYTRDFVRELYACVKNGIRKKRTLKEVYAMTRRRMDPQYSAYPIYEHCMPFDVSRAGDEARGIRQPRIWTAERDAAMRKSIA